MGLRRKYFLIFLSLFVVLFTMMSLTTYFISNHILIKKYKELSFENVSYILDITEKEMNQLVNTYAFIATNSIVLQRLETDYNKKSEYEKLIDDVRVTEMLHALGSFDIFNSINLMYIYSATGEEYWYGSGGEFTDIELFKETLNSVDMQKNKLYYLGLNQSIHSITKNKMLKFSRLLFNRNNEVVGKIYFELEAKYFKNIYDNERLLSGTSLTLIDNDRKIIYHADEELVGSRYVEEEYDGIIIENEINGYGWKLISKTPKNQIIDENKMIIKMTVLMAIVSLILSIVLISLVTRRIVDPIAKLSSAMNKVMSGNLDVKVNYQSDDEIGWLTESFNKMTKKLKDNLKKEIEHTKALNDAEYKALQAQINPHFMYNSLNALRWMAKIQKADNIIGIVDALWILLKKTSSFGGQFISFKNEIEIIDAYAKIQQFRYKGKFKIAYEIDENHLNNIIPKYILQPFVENAIFHGIEPKKGTGTITIATRIKGRNLEIEVKDDGIGISEEQLAKILSEENYQHQKGFNNIGVKNVDERLKLLFGLAYGIKIESIEGEGTRVTILIPLEGAK